MAAITISSAWVDRGVHLEDLGISDLAWTITDALMLVDEAAKQGGAVLGGDVYVEVDGDWESAYENWYCDKRPGEQLAGFVQRSAEEARRYLSNLQTRGTEVRVTLITDRVFEFVDLEDS